MLEVCIGKNGEVKKLCAKGSLSDLQADFVMAISRVYASLFNSDAGKDAAKEFIDGMSYFFSDTENRDIILQEGVKLFSRNVGFEVCEIVNNGKKSKKELSAEQLESALKKLEEIADALGIDD